MRGNSRSFSSVGGGGVGGGNDNVGNDFMLSDPNAEKLNQFFGGDLQENPSDDLLKKMETFVENHCKSLSEIQESFTERVTQTWNSHTDFVSIDVTPYENVNNPVFLIHDQLYSFSFVFCFFLFVCLFVFFNTGNRKTQTHKHMDP